MPVLKGAAFSTVKRTPPIRFKRQRCYVATFTLGPLCSEFRNAYVLFPFFSEFHEEEKGKAD